MRARAHIHTHTHLHTRIHIHKQARTQQTPAGSGEEQQVTISVAATEQPVQTISYSYKAPTVTSVSGDLFTQNGGEITIVGTQFGTESTATLVAWVDGKELTSTILHTETRVVLADLPTGSGSAVLTVDITGQSTSYSFSYAAPEINNITSVALGAGNSLGGDEITINGRNFKGGNASVAVMVGEQLCTIVDVDYARIICTTPAGSGMAAVEITLEGQSNLEMRTWVYAPPTITSVTPSEGATLGGETVVIEGYSLEEGSVDFGGLSAEVCVFSMGRSISCSVPAGQGRNLPVKLTSFAGVQSNTDITFSYVRPVIDRWPAGPFPTAGGDVISFTGANFGVSTPLVTLGSVLCEVSSHNHTWLECITAGGTGQSLPVLITVGGQSNEAGAVFSYSVPVISSVQAPSLPTNPKGAVSLTVQGTDFYTVTGKVYVGSAECAIQLWTPTNIECFLPAGRGRVHVTVEHDSGSFSAGVNITYDGPTITAVAPLSAAPSGGDMLTVTGGNFPVGGDTKVAIGGKVCSITKHQFDDEIECSVPAGGGKGLTVTVTADGKQDTASQLFSYFAPVLIFVSPLLVPSTGDTNIIVRGRNFGQDASSISVTVGGMSGTITSLSSGDVNEINFTPPAGTGIGKQIIVTVGGQPSTGFFELNYQAPNISSLSESDTRCIETNSSRLDSCSLFHEINITIRGRNFGSDYSGLTVTVGDSSCTNPRASDPAELHYAVVCTLAESVSGVDLDVTISTEPGQEGTLTGAVSYAIPRFQSGTLRIQGLEAEPGSTFVDLVLGKNTAVLGVQNRVIGGLVEVRLGLPGQAFEERSLVCTDPQFEDSLTGSTLNCTVPAGGVGAVNFVMKTTIDGVPGPLSRESVDMVRYPPPECVPNTIRGGLNLLGSDRFEATFASRLFFEAKNVGEDPALVSVNLKKINENESNENESVKCEFLQIFDSPLSANASANSAVISCTLTGGSSGGLFSVQLTVAGQEAKPGMCTDFVEIPQQPIVEAVSVTTGGSTSCANNGIAVENCSTTGNDVITIRGKNFRALSLSSRIGSQVCTSVAFINSTALTCRLPPGVGSNVSVSVVVGAQFSQPKELVSYRQPSVTAITGCDTAAASSNAMVVGCARRGSNIVTLLGADLGVGNKKPSVLVGGKPCELVSFDSLKIEFQLPAGSGDANEVIVLQAGGPFVVTNLTVGYVDCSEGEAPAADGSCAECVAGKYRALGSLICSNCPSGRFSRAGAGECTLCTSGNYSVASAANGPTSCSECSAGSYSSLGGAALCLECPVGKFAEGVGNVRCQSCDVGRFSSSPKSATCQPCAAGSFAEFPGSSACLRCGRGTASNGTVSCSACDAGTFSSEEGGTVCTPCPAGTYADSSRAVECSECSSGRFSNVTGLAECFECPPGKYSDVVSGFVGCTDCAAGSYMPEGGQQVCLLCDAGTFAKEAGSKSCAACGKGYSTSLLGSTECFSCAEGKYAGAEGSVVCQDCPVGYYSDTRNATECRACVLGRYGNSRGLASCADCATGRYADSVGLSECLDCPAGRFANRTALEGCFDCSAGQSSEPGASACLNCEVGSFAATTGSPTCLLCDAGEEPNPERSDCRICLAGKYSPFIGAGTCTNCSAGYFSGEGASSCSICPTGSYSVEGSDKCTPCSPGSYQKHAGQSSCSPCSRGRFSAFDGTALCTSCPPGSVSRVLAGSSACDLCQEGQYQGVAGGWVACSACSEGRYAPSAGTVVCLECKAGSYQNKTASASCEPCSPGTFAALPGLVQCSECQAGKASSAGSTACSDCTAGRVAPVKGTASCALCPAGKVQPGEGKAECVPCTPGRYAAVDGLFTCSDCVQGTFTGNYSASACETCTAGKYANAAGQVACTDCTVGKYAADRGAFACAACFPGRYGPGQGLSGCLKCPRGRSQSLEGQAECTPCSPGSVAKTEGSFECEPCTGGSIAQNASEIQCDICEVGTYSNANIGSIACKQCETGKYQDAREQSKCVTCPPGRFSVGVGNTECTACGPGEQQPLPGQSSCEPCPQGYASAANGTVVCVPCTPGSYTNSTGKLLCTPCAAGRAQTIRGVSQCLTCPKGTYQSANGQDQCLSCPKGRFSDEEGQKACRVCSPGTVAAEERSTECALCSPGTFSPGATHTHARTHTHTHTNTHTHTHTHKHTHKHTHAHTCTHKGGEATCQECAVGRAANKTGQAECEECKPGFFQGEGKQAICFACQPGSYNPTRRSKECQLCDPGRFASSIASVACSLCPVGRANALNGQSECAVCDVGHVQPSTGQNECVACKPGNFANHTMKLECDRCLNGYSSDLGSGECWRCKEGETSDLETGSCTQCQPGTYSPKNKDGCYPCEKGKYQDSAGENDCSPCEKGKFQNREGQKQCDQCPAGQYTNITGQAECNICRMGRSTDGVGGRSNCTVCNPGSSAPEAGAARCGECITTYTPSPFQDCLPCWGNAVPRSIIDTNVTATDISGMNTCVCRNNYLLVHPDRFDLMSDEQRQGMEDEMKEQLDRWKSNNPNLTWTPLCFACSDGAACEDAGTTLENVQAKAGWSRGLGREGMYRFYRCPNPKACEAVNNTSASNSMLNCAEGYTGMLCNQCAPGYGSSGPHECTPCPSKSWNAGRLFLAVICTCIFFALFVTFNMRTSSAGKSEASIVLKLFTSGIQFNAVAASLEYDWPAFAKGLLDMQHATINIGTSLVNTDCFVAENSGQIRPVYVKSLVLALIPLVSVLLAVAILSLVNIYRVRKDKAWSHQQIRDMCVASVCLVLFIIHPSLTLATFRMMRCVNLGDDVSSFLLADLSQRCYHGAHLRYFALTTLPMLIFYVIGIPALGFFLLFRNQHKLRNDARVQLKYAFLFAGYKDDRYYWEVVIMARKVVLVTVAVFFSDVIHIQALLVILLVVMAIISHLIFQPFKIPRMNRMESLSLGCSFCIFFFGQFLFVETGGSTDLRQAVSVLISLAFFTFFFVYIVVFCQKLGIAVKGKLAHFRKTLDKLAPMEKGDDPSGGNMSRMEMVLVRHAATPAASSSTPSYLSLTGNDEGMGSRSSMPQPGYGDGSHRPGDDLLARGEAVVGKGVEAAGEGAAGEGGRGGGSARTRRESGEDVGESDGSGKEI